MEYKVIDMENSPRRDQFELFSSYAYPYFGLTVNVDITDFLRKVKEREVDFFLSFCWCVYRAANAVPEFKQRIKDDVSKYLYSQTKRKPMVLPIVMYV